MSLLDVAREAAPPVDRLLREKALVFVSGKGGAGKTTVAAVLGVAAAERGRRTIVCELAGAAHLAPAFGLPVGMGRETRLADRLWCVTLDPREALREWLRRQPGGTLADTVLSRSRAFAHFVEAAPGAKEVVTIGKVLDLAGRAPGDGRRHPAYELVVVDAPSTGHALGMLAAPGSISEVAPRGPVATQARALRAVLADAQATGYVGVSLPEEMSVREVLELEQGLDDALGRELDVIVVNGVYPDRFSDDEAKTLEALAAGPDPAGALRASLLEHHRARIHAEHVRSLRARARAPVITLPYVFAPAIGPADYERLARELAGEERRGDA
jgi:anion-transporting  ArsA/GET3 family ATPase